MDTGLSTPITVAFVLLPGSLILDWAGPAEAMRIANRCLQAQGQAPRFVLRFLGPAPQAESSVGATLTGLEPLPASLPEPAWLVLVGQSGSTVDVATPEAQALLRWLRGIRPQAGRLELMTVCAGALLAAHAGLLDGRRATTHHHHLDELSAVAPRCDRVANRVFVQDGPVYSSAGVTTGIDLFLHRIADECGPALAAQVAQAMVVALRRGPQDPELSPFLAHRQHLHGAVHKVQDALARAPAEHWPLDRMAKVACTSGRHLARLFAEHAGIAPLAYLRELRLGLARAALQAGYNVTQAAAMAGFGSDTQLRRAWQEGVDGTLTPSRWRAARSR